MCICTLFPEDPLPPTHSFSRGQDANKTLNGDLEEENHRLREPTDISFRQVYMNVGLSKPITVQKFGAYRPV